MSDQISDDCYGLTYTSNQMGASFYRFSHLSDKIGDGCYRLSRMSDMIGACCYRLFHMSDQKGDGCYRLSYLSDRLTVSGSFTCLHVYYDKQAVIGDYTHLTR
jgi:hypothetical protein